MIVALLFFALVSAFTAAASVMLMGFSFWIALISYPLAGMTALLLGATLIAFGKTLSRTPQNHRKPAHA
jgi:membrane protein implicated in regulation of membrane protease activity